MWDLVKRFRELASSLGQGVPDVVWGGGLIAFLGFAAFVLYRFLKMIERELYPTERKEAPQEGRSLPVTSEQTPSTLNQGPTSLASLVTKLNRDDIYGAYGALEALRDVPDQWDALHLSDDREVIADRYPHLAKAYPTVPGLVASFLRGDLNKEQFVGLAKKDILPQVDRVHISGV